MRTVPYLTAELSSLLAVYCTELSLSQFNGWLQIMVRVAGQTYRGVLRSLDLKEVLQRYLNYPVNYDPVIRIRVSSY